MNRTLLSLSLLAAFGSSTAFGQSEIGNASTLSKSEAAEVEWKDARVRELESIPFRKSGLNKHTSTQVLVTETFYDYSYTGNPLASFARYSYSNGRGSAFNYISLDYGGVWINNSPDPLHWGDAHVDFDTIYDYNGKIVGIQSYSSANQPISYETSTRIYLWSYDASQRPTSKTDVQFSFTTFGFDSTARNHYRYDASGFLVSDSLVTWIDSLSTWIPTSRFVYTNDASGRTTSASYEKYLAGSFGKREEYLMTYSGGSPLPSKYTKRIEKFSGMENLSQIDFFYDGSGNLTGRDYYTWDATNTAWNANGNERRHLNAAGLPDSVYSSSVPTSYILLSYTSQNNPIFKKLYRADTLFREYRWSYDPNESTSVKNLKAAPLEFYPNPASDKIQLKGVTTGSFSIFNSAGQLVQSGQLQNGGSIPVQFLSPGMYTLTVQDASRQVAQAIFLRQ